MEKEKWRKPIPEFCVNKPENRSHPFYSLSEFAKGYVEAMFFTNCDSGHEDDFKANNLGVGRLTAQSVLNIACQCHDFLQMAAPCVNGEPVTMRELIDAASGKGYTDEQAGADFWFTRQGHGVGFWDREELDSATGQALSAAAKSMGEAYVDIYGGWIHHP